MHKVADLVIRGGRIIDPASGLDRVGTILIRDGKIVAISGPRFAQLEAEDASHRYANTRFTATSGSEEPSSYMDARNLLVVPALVDMHAHCFTEESGPLPAPGEADAPSGFRFAAMRQDLAEGRVPDTISSDLPQDGEADPVSSQLDIMSKLLHLGMPLTEIIAAATWRPAVALRRAETMGSLAVGRVADISLIALTRGQFSLTDSEGVTESAYRLFKLVLTIRAGQVERPLAVK